MKEIQFPIEISATKEKVWNTLWQDETFRDWSGIIDPGTHIVGELKEGNEVQFLTTEGGFGVTSLVEKLTPNEFLQLAHQADTQNDGKEEREKEWTGGKESYTLTETNGVTTLVVAYDIPPSQEEYFQKNFPKALARVKELAESK